jgi:hypothetical protein
MSMLKEFTQVVALITVLSTAIYLIGFIALCWPIYRSHTRDDPSTGLYAAALVPRTVVAGQGVRIFVGFPLIAALFLLIFLSTARWEREILEWAFRRPLNDVLHQILVGFIAICITLSFIWFVKRLRTEGLGDFFFTPLNRPDASPFRLFSIFLGALGAAVGGVLILTADKMSWGTLFLALVFFSGAIALAGVPDAVSIEPPLPKVKITETTKGGEVNNYEGKLLSHYESHWYVFEEGEGEHILHMIPDDNAEVSCVQAK